MGLLAVGVVVALTFFGSGQLTWFDPAPVGYLFGTVFAVFGVGYRDTVWLRRAPTAMLNRRGWEAFCSMTGRNLAAYFDARTGAVLSGPPPRPLGRIDVEVRGDDVVWALGYEP